MNKFNFSFFPYTLFLWPARCINLQKWPAMKTNRIALMYYITQEDSGTKEGHIKVMDTKERILIGPMNMMKTHSKEAAMCAKILYNMLPENAPMTE